MEITQANAQQWLTHHAHWQVSDFYPKRLAHALVGIVEHLINNGYTLHVNSVDGDLKNNMQDVAIGVNGPAAQMLAVVGVELSGVLAGVGLELMDADWLCEFAYPARSDGVVLQLHLM